MTSAPLIVPIVEGHGEVEAVPLLLRRISTALRPELVPVINPPTRIKASSFLSDEAYFQKYIKQASRNSSFGRLKQRIEAHLQHFHTRIP